MSCAFLSSAARTAVSQVGISGFFAAGFLTAGFFSAAAFVRVVLVAFFGARKLLRPLSYYISKRDFSVFIQRGAGLSGVFCRLWPGSGAFGKSCHFTVRGYSCVRFGQR
jgi:hypothetical protein